VASGLILTPAQIAKRTRQILAAYPQSLHLPSYRLHAPSGRGVIQYKPLFGPNPKYLTGAYGSPESLDDYARKLARVAKHKIAGKAPQLKRTKERLGTMTMRRFLGLYFIWAEKHHGQGRELSHLKRCARPLRQKFGEQEVRSIGPVRLKKVRREMVRLGWSRKHINAQLIRLRSIFTWGVENELLHPNQLRALQTVRGLRKGKTTAPEREPVGPVVWSEAQQLLPHVRPVLAAMVEIQYLTGMRSAELTAMCIAEIEFRADVWIYRPVKHKTAYAGKNKIICLGPRSQELLIPYLQVPLEQYLFSPRIAERERMDARRAAAKAKPYGKRAQSRFNPYRFRERYFTDSYYQALGYGFDRMDKDRPKDDPVNRWHPHQLRHARATLTREKFSLEGSQAQLGNTLQATQIYAEKSLPLAIEIAIQTG
jgi:integrase